MNLKAITIFLAALFGSSVAVEYSGLPYNRVRTHSSCKPSAAIQAAPTCDGLGNYSAVDVNGIYNNYDLLYNVLGSRYYFARYVEALGLSSDCPTSDAALNALNLVTSWSGLNGAVAIDGTEGFNTCILRKCTFPTDTHPFLCTGASATPGTQGGALGTLSYIPLLQDTNNRWTLFGHCWNAQRPSSPNAAVVAVSFNVFCLDSFLSDADFALVIAQLEVLGFSTSSDNLIRPVFPTF